MDENTICQNDQKEIKVNVLTNAWNDVSRQIETVSDYENKTSISYVTFMAAFTYYVTKDSIIHLSDLIAYLLIIVGSCIVISWFLQKNRTRMMWLCQSLIKIQKALSMYEPGVYLPKCKADKTNPEHPLQKSIVFGWSGQEWGKTTKYLNSIPHLAMVIMSSIGAATFIISKVCV